MKRKVTIIILIILVIILCFISGFIVYRNYKLNQEKKAQERYAEIRKDVEKAVEWNIHAMYPGCSISKDFDAETASSSAFYNSSWLINNGYLKKSELLDLDNKSYCDIYVEHYTLYENPYDHQKNCETYYIVYLKCKDYEDKGYVNWGR